jgi:hypothetical protein
MTNHKLDPVVLGQFTGTEQWFRHGLARNVLYTEGVQYVAETAGAYWLLDEIAFGQHRPKIRREEFQVWKLVVAENGTAKLFVEDGNDNKVWSKRIDYTDFPEGGITLWFTGGTILLPSEY